MLPSTYYYSYYLHWKTIMRIPHQNTSGFTLIELVMVIVILGVLAAVAIPKFTNLSTDAQASVDKNTAAVGTINTAIEAACRATPGNSANDSKCAPAN